ncbi:MAG TPA: Hsp20/alpha crystallin family protein [Rhodanobacter sp.]
MSVTQLIPWNLGSRSRSRDQSSLVRAENRDPIFALQRGVNRLFDDLWNGFEMPSLRDGLIANGWPTVELVEHDEDFVLTVEMPGMNEKDVDVQFVDGTLILRGERKEDRDDVKNDLRYSERFYGRFERRIPLGVDISHDKAKAVLRHGVLTVTLPKVAQNESQTHRIPVSNAA